MKKTLIGGVAAIAVVAGGTAAFALTAGAQEPEAPPAPTTTATAEPTASATAQPTPVPTESAFPDADEAAFLALVQRDWQGEGLPTDDELLVAGYDRCNASAGERVEHQDDFWPDWSGANNMMVGFAAEYLLCPVAG